MEVTSKALSHWKIKVTDSNFEVGDLKLPLDETVEIQANSTDVTPKEGLKIESVTAGRGFSLAKRGCSNISW